MTTMQRHDTLAYIENTITGNLDKQQQSMATNQTLVNGRKDDKQSSSTSAQKQQSKHQYFGTKMAKQVPVPWHKSGKASTSTLAQKRLSKHQYLAQKRQTKNQYLSQFEFIQIILPVVYYHSF